MTANSAKHESCNKNKHTHINTETHSHTHTHSHTQLDRIDDHNDTQTIAGAFQFNSIYKHGFVFFSFILLLFIFFFGIFPLCLRPWQSLSNCPTVHCLRSAPRQSIPLFRASVLCRNLKVVLTVAKIEFLFNLYGFVRWPAPSYPRPYGIVCQRTLYLVSR